MGDAGMTAIPRSTYTRAAMSSLFVLRTIKDTSSGNHHGPLTRIGRHLPHEFLLGMERPRWLLVGATGAGSGDLPARRPRCLGVTFAGFHGRAVGLGALGGFRAGLLGLVGLVGVEPDDPGRADVTMNLEKIAKAWPERDAWICAEPLERNPCIAFLVDRKLDANGNNPGSDTAGRIALAE
ncbi:hypothetical protein ACWEOO_06825 [Kribbella sp. NPDC004138]